MDSPSELRAIDSYITSGRGHESSIIVVCGNPECPAEGEQREVEGWVEFGGFEPNSDDDYTCPECGEMVEEAC